jgi:hypothetical protein
VSYYRAQIGFAFDSGFPRDVVQITPHYQGDDPGALATALKTNLIAQPDVTATMPFRIKIYDAEKPPPSYPLADVSNASGFVTSSKPRELALCLSYFSGFNRPRFRGRMYIPSQFITGAAALRPTAGQVAQALSWTNTLGAGLPSGTNWVVWSKKDGVGRTVTDTWVDDEWDVIRSRGLRGTVRQADTLP